MMTSGIIVMTADDRETKPFIKARSLKTMRVQHDLVASAHPRFALPGADLRPTPAYCTRIKLVVRLCVSWVICWPDSPISRKSHCMIRSFIRG